MSSTGQVHKTKRAGTKLRSDNIDDDKQVRKHKRVEGMKDHLYHAKVIALYGGLAGLPLLYLMFLCVNWHDESIRNEWIRTGIAALVAYILGKAKITFGNKE